MSHYTISCTSGDELFTPKSLEQLCTDVCAAEAKILFFVPLGDKLTMRRGLSGVPRNILEQVLDHCDHSAPEYIPMLLELCKNAVLGTISLKRLNLNYCEFLTDSHFEQLMKVKPTSLEIDECLKLTSRALDIINEHGENLVSLNFGFSGCRISSTMQERWTDFPLGLLNTPRLRRLSTSQLDGGDKFDILECLTRAFIGGLEHLELSQCEGITSLNCLLKAKDTLKSLVFNFTISMDDPTHRESFWNVVPQLRNLRLLDVTGSDMNRHNNKIDVLDKLVGNLPQLTHLDLGWNHLENVATNEIHELESQRPLDFLNLCGSGISELVPARVLVKEHDELLAELMCAIKNYRQGRGELPSGMVDSLEYISKADEIPWKVAVDLLMQVAGPYHLDYCCGMGILLNALDEPCPLAPAQLDQIPKWLIKVLSRSYEYNFDKITDAIDFLPALSLRMDLWDPRIANMLVPALLQAVGTGIKGFRKSIKGPGESEWLIRCIGDHLCENLTVSSALIRAKALDQKALRLVRQVMKLDIHSDTVQLYRKIYENLMMAGS